MIVFPQVPLYPLVLRVVRRQLVLNALSSAVKGLLRLLHRTRFNYYPKQALSESILRHLDHGVIAVDPQGCTTLVNAAATRLIGLEVAEAVGKPAVKVLPDSLAGPLLQTLTEHVTYANCETTLHLTSGRILPIAFSTAVLQDKADRRSGALLTVYDLSQVKELEEEKRRTERLASVGAFVSGIAHEIKNPLVAIKALAELLPEQYYDEEFRQTFSRVALHEVDRIDALVQRLRDLGPVPPSNKCRMNVLAPLDETLALLSGELTRRHIALVYQNQPPIPSIMGDHDQLKQVFLNLCLNSIEAMENDGSLSIHLSTEPSREARPTALLIHISDTGPGVPRADLSIIFDPFVTTKAYGSGLGLAICKDIIEHHDGTITAMNCGDGPGARFIVRLPVAQEEDMYEVAPSRRRSAQAADPVA